MTRATSAAADTQRLFEGAHRLHQGGQLETAAEAYRRVLDRDPRHFLAVYLLATIALQTGQSADGVELFQRAVRINPSSHEALCMLGIGLYQLGRAEEAVGAFNRSIRLRLDYAEAHFNLGLALSALDRHPQALASYDRAVALRPDYLKAHINRGAALDALDRPADALASYDAVIRMAPGLPEAHDNRGVLLHKLGRFDEALACHARTLSLNPGLAKAHNHRGQTLSALGRADEAMASYREAFRLDPSFAEAWHNLGYEYEIQNRLGDALQAYRTASRIDPDRAESLEAEAFCLLRAGDFERGWPAFEHRLRRWDAPVALQTRVPRWTGREDLGGGRLLVHHEQGFGDIIQFCRFIPALRERGLALTVSVLPALKSLIRTLAPDLPFVDDYSVPNDTGAYVSMMSLPCILGTRLDTVPAPVRYLHSDSAKRARFEALVGPKVRPRVGLAWSGNPGHPKDRERSLPFRDLAPLLGDAVDWICLQQVIRPTDRADFESFGRVRFLGDALTEFADTAALVDLLDLVISVDTSVAHLAGALGKPVWILLPFCPDFRWLLGREDSPWYPSARLLRQADPGDWTSVFTQLGRRLAAFVETGDSGRQTVG